MKLFTLYSENIFIDESNSNDKQKKNEKITLKSEWKQVVYLKKFRVVNSDCDYRVALIYSHTQLLTHAYTEWWAHLWRHWWRFWFEIEIGNLLISAVWSGGPAINQSNKAFLSTQFIFNNIPPIQFTLSIFHSFRLSFIAERIFSSFFLLFKYFDVIVQAGGDCLFFT